MYFVDEDNDYRTKYIKYKTLALEKQREINLLDDQEGGKAPKVCAASRTNPDIDGEMEAIKALKKIKEDELENLEIFRNSYDLSRYPSYCDRILSRTVQIKTAEDVSVEKTEYNSYVNHAIAKSDHDLVYAVYNVKNGDIDINILIVTWNQNGLSPRIANVLDPDFYKRIGIEGVKDHTFFDIIAFAQQESSHSDSLFGLLPGDDSLQNSLISFGKKEKMIVRAERTGFGNFHVRLTVMLTAEFNKRVVSVRKAAQCLNGELCTKSVCGIGLTLDTSSPNLSLNFFSAHMPVDIKKEDLGLDSRVKAYQKIDKFIEKKFTSQKSRDLNQIDFIAGDLNFRYNTGRIAGDQLTSVMADGKAFADFGEGESNFPPFEEGERGFPPTCKRQACK